MNWLQAFAFVALAGFHGAYGEYYYQTRGSGSGKDKYYHNSFPYKSTFLDTKGDRDLFTSTIVSRSGGLLCSGFHILPTVVVTAASCVFRHESKDLTVISNVKGNSTSPSGKFEHLLAQDYKVHPKYNPVTDEHNIALVYVKPPTSEIYILSLLGGDMQAVQGASPMYFAKFSYTPKKNDFFPVRVHATVSLNVNACGSNTQNFLPDVFLCVTPVHAKPYKYGLRDLGTPLVFGQNEKYYFLGMFTGHDYTSEYKSHLYQSARGNSQFINTFKNGKN